MARTAVVARQKEPIVTEREQIPPVQGSDDESRRGFLSRVALATGALFALHLGKSTTARASSSNCGKFGSEGYISDATCNDFYTEPDYGCGKWTGEEFDQDDRCSATKTVNPPTTWADEGCGHEDPGTGLFDADDNCGVGQGCGMEAYVGQDFHGGAVVVQWPEGDPVLVTDPDESCNQAVVPGAEWVDQDNDCSKPTAEQTTFYEDQSCGSERAIGGTYPDNDCDLAKPGGGTWDDNA
jgi:hypothetical protein